MSTDDRVQSARNAWVNALRAEVLRVGRRIPEVARVATVGMWIASYADADGSNSFPGRDTLATLSGCSVETVTNATRVLMGVGLLGRKRRPNASSMYQLLMPLGSGLDWAPHMHHMTNTRQRRDYAKKKAAEIAKAMEERTASTDAVENPVDDDADSVHRRVPDSVRSGGSEPSDQDPDSVRGRPRKTSVDAVRAASVAGVYQYIPTFGRDPLPDKDMAGLSPQVQRRAGEVVKDESSTGEAGRPGAPRSAALAAVRVRDPLARCLAPDCGMPLPYGAAGLCTGCADYLNVTERHSA